MHDWNGTEPEVENLLSEIRAGDAASSDRLFELLHGELRRLAATVFQGQNHGHTLQPTGLVHEVWLKIAGSLDSVKDKKHFFALAARAMRQILADHARAQNSVKRGGGFHRVTLSTNRLTSDDAGYDAIAFHDALDSLARLNERYAQIAELRILGSLTIEEIADLLDTSAATASREWQAVRLWLIRELRGP